MQIDPALVSDVTTLKRFLAEARATGRLAYAAPCHARELGAW